MLIQRRMWDGESLGWVPYCGTSGQHSCPPPTRMWERAPSPVQAERSSALSSPSRPRYSPPSLNRIPARKFAFNAGYPATSSYRRFNALSMLAYAVTCRLSAYHPPTLTKA
jgi:hypothetical protein